MKIQIMSDLHLECDKFYGKEFLNALPIVGELLVLAGDVVSLADKTRAACSLSQLCDKFAHVVYVPGNHEYYGTGLREGHEFLAHYQELLPNLHVLNPGVTTINGTRFVGATLWFPIQDEDLCLSYMLRDFGAIESFVGSVGSWHAGDVEFLRSNIQPGDVVITHHLPHPRSVAKEYEGDPINAFFLANDVQDLVEDRGAQLWIHGHTHTSCDYTVGTTRVVCNPHGYGYENRKAFDPALVVNVNTNVK